MFILNRMDHRETWSPVDLPEDQIAEKERENRYDNSSMLYLCGFSLICAVVILVCGVLLVRLADTLAVQTGLGTSFIGASLLALTTSMPELSTSIAAVRVKAYTMAISNVLGSNLIMTFLIVPNDFMFGKGALINEIDESALFAIGAGIIMTAIYCIGILSRPNIKIFNMGLDSFLLGLLYLASLFALYTLR